MGNHDPHAHEAEWQVAEVATFLFLIWELWQSASESYR
jgi:hypothetical protein